MTVAHLENLATGDRERNKLLDYAVYLINQGYAESTVESYHGMLKQLVNSGAKLDNPESVKKAIANQKWVNKRKANSIHAYNVYCQRNGVKWNPPEYRPREKLPWIPKEEELDALITRCGRKTRTLLLLLKETGVRIGEACMLEWNDVDFERGVVNVTAEKGSRGRAFALSNELMNLLVAAKVKNRVQDGRIFSKTRTARRVYEKQRTRIAEELGNPRMKRISFHTFRHWYGTVRYHETKDIVYVQRMLGHRNINNTLMYIHLEEAYFRDEAEEYDVRKVRTVEDAVPLLEDGYEEASEIDGVKLFRKRRSKVAGAVRSGAGGLYPKYRVGLLRIIKTFEGDLRARELNPRSNTSAVKY